MEKTDFYKEEVRSGYRITEKTKRVWAVQLAMLDEVERICRKYGLTYFADSGTLIGCIRDEGYIPWDDDIDLVMLREDYDRFLAAARAELPEYLLLQTYRTEKNYLRGHAQIRDTRTTGCNAEDRRAGYNCGIFIDIFPLDNMPDSRAAARLWAWAVRTVWMVLYTWYRFDYYENATRAGWLLNRIGRILSIPQERACGFYERLCALFAGKPGKYVCSTTFIQHLEKNTWKRSWFSQAVYKPFENRKIPVPVGYDKRLKKEYGDYRKPAKAPALHGGLLLDPDRPYDPAKAAVSEGTCPKDA